MRSLMNAFILLPCDQLCDWYRITEAEFLGKVSAFIADGASELGTRRRGKRAEVAVEGENVFHKLQVRRDACCGTELPKIIGYWCVSHQIDLVAHKPEKKMAFVASLVGFLRSIVGHIMGSSRAQGLLQFIAKLIYNQSGANEHASSSSLAKVHHAPQRWLSLCAPMACIVSRVCDLVLYLYNLTLEKEEALREFGRKLFEQTKDIRFYLVLAGILDILMIVHKFNKTTQPGGVSLKKVADALEMCEAELKDLVMRTDTTKHMARIPERSIAFFDGTHDVPAASTATQFEQMCGRLKVKKMKKRRTREIVRTATLAIEYKQNDQARSFEVEMKLTSELMQEVMAVLVAYGGSVLRDLARRFSGTSIVKDLLVAFDVVFEFRNGESQAPESSLKRLAEFFKVPPEDLKQAWRILQLRKDVYVHDLLERGGSAKTRQDINFVSCWAAVLDNLTGEAEVLEEVNAAMRPLKLAILLEPTNAGVERDAGLKRTLKIVMEGHGSPDTIDARMRVCAEGPPVGKGDIKSDVILVEAVREFLFRANRRESAGRRQMPARLSPKHKARISATRKRPATARNADDPVGVAFLNNEGRDEGAQEEIEDGDSLEEVDANELHEAQTLQFGDLAAFAETLPSLQKPPPKRARRQPGADLRPTLATGDEDVGGEDAGDSEDGDEDEDEDEDEDSDVE